MRDVRRLDQEMADPHKTKTKELQSRLAALGARLQAGDDSELLVWIILGALACAHRPLRKHPIYGKPQFDLPLEAAPLVLAWIDRIKREGIRSIIVLMGEKELRHYTLASDGASSLLELYERENLSVTRISWEDPAHAAVAQGPSYAEQVERCRSEALAAFDALPKPVLLHCSSGIQRSSPVAAFLHAMRAQSFDV